jgi:hypothetical protein
LKRPNKRSKNEKETSPGIIPARLILKGEKPHTVPVPMIQIVAINSCNQHFVIYEVKNQSAKGILRT